MASGALLLALALIPASGVAQSAHGDPAKGHQLAQAWCSSCHQVEAGEAKSQNDAVPSFRSIARMPSTTALSLRAFLRTPHPPMPDLRLTEAQIADVNAYILTLRGR